MREKVISICVHCGESFAYHKPRRGKQKRTYCSASCRSAHTRISVIRNRYVLDCVICGASFTSTHTHSKICSRECRRKHLANKQRVRRRSTVRVCRQCGREFNGDPDRVYCSCQCKTAKGLARRQLAHEERLARRPKCNSCGERFYGRNSICTRCSKKESTRRRLQCPRCGTKHTNPPSRKVRMCGTCKASALRNQRRKDRYNRKQRMRANQPAGAEPVVRRTVFERDGWRCQHCRCRCIAHSRERGDNQATIDHIIPIAKGGSHTYENVQLLCRRCNERKQATLVIPEQMRVIG